MKGWEEAGELKQNEHLDVAVGGAEGAFVRAEFW